MPIKILFRRLAHLVCLSACLALLACVVLLTRKGRNDNILRTELIGVFKTGLRAHDRAKDDFYKKVNENYLKDPVEATQIALEWVEKLKTNNDSLDVLIDSLFKFPNARLAKAVKGKLESYPAFIRHLARNDPHKSKDLQSIFSWYFANLDTSIHWLDRVCNSLSQQQIMALTKMHCTIKLLNSAILEYCLNIQGTPIICRWGPLPAWNVLTVNPIAGDKVDIEVHLAWDWENHCRIEYWANGKELAAKDGVAKFRTRYSSPGVHPVNLALKVTDPVTDSVRFIEKTYFVRVQE